MIRIARGAPIGGGATRGAGPAGPAVPVEEELQQTLQRADDEGVAKFTIQKQMRELQNNLTEMAEDLEAERDVKNKAEKQKRDLNEELEALRGELEDSLDTTAAAQDLKQKREEELNYFNSTMDKNQKSFETRVAEMRSKHQAQIEQMSEKLENVRKNVDKLLERSQHEHEMEQLKREKEAALADETKVTKAALDAMRKAFEEELETEKEKYPHALETMFTDNYVEEIRRRHEYVICRSWQRITINKLLAALNIPRVRPKTLKKREREVGNVIEKIAKESCQDVAQKELSLS